MPIFETQRVRRIEAFEADNRSWLFFFGRTAHPPACNGLLIYVPKLRRGQRRTVQPTHTTSTKAMNNATNVSETNLTWKWTTEFPPEVPIEMREWIGPRG